jgi:hypothetical protein
MHLSKGRQDDPPRPALTLKSALRCAAGRNGAKVSTEPAQKLSADHRPIDNRHPRIVGARWRVPPNAAMERLSTASHIRSGASLAGNGEPGEPAGKLPGRHDRHQQHDARAAALEAAPHQERGRQQAARVAPHQGPFLALQHLHRRGASKAGGRTQLRRTGIARAGHHKRLPAPRS